jgi:hypothetical protein
MQNANAPNSCQLGFSGIELMSDGKLTEIFPFAGCLPGRFIRTMSVSIGGLSKDELFEQAKSVRSVSPYAKRLMKHERFTTLPVRTTIHQIVLTPEDLGFSDRPTIAEMLDNERLAKWSSANLKGWRVETNPPEVGPQLAIQYKGQPQNEFLWIAMERIPGSGGRPYVFYLERNDEDVCSLDAHWTYPYALWRMDYLVSFRLTRISEASP